MTHEHNDALKSKFWEAFAKSPFVMIGPDAIPHSSVPMTAQLDDKAHSAIWFFTRHDSDMARLGPATAHFCAKDHHVFARFAGTLAEEADRAILDHFWSNAIAAWFPGGKDDPNLLFLRMDLGRAAIWSADLGIGDTIKMLLGGNVRDGFPGGGNRGDETGQQHIETFYV